MRIAKVTGILFAVIIIVSCARLDVVGKKSVESFGAALEKLPQAPEADAMNGGWVLRAPDNSAQFF
ncbi:MAG: hypothetical protein LBN21_06245, partial [Treponema sp.]|nr:hypothetical protein [Treponema sp.]